MVASSIASRVILAVSGRRARAGLLPAWTSNQASCRTGVASRRAENDQLVSVTQRTIYLWLPKSRFDVAETELQREPARQTRK